MTSTIELRQLAASIRAIAGNPEDREAFIVRSVTQVRDLQRANAQAYENKVSALLLCLESFEAVNGPSLDVLCELTVLDVLFSLELSAIQLLQCNSYLRLCLRSANELDVVRAAANTFAQSLNYSQTTDFVHSQIDDFLEWTRLTDPSDSLRRLCGILVLTEVAARIPVVVLSKLNDIFASVWEALAVKKGELRSRALVLFCLSVKLLGKKATASCEETYDSLMKELKAHLSAKTKEKKIAGLLAFEPIVLNSIGTVTLKYEELSLMLVPFMMSGGSSTTNAEIRELVFRCLVALCRFDVLRFTANQLRDAVRYALDSVKREIQRATALDMLREIIPVVGRDAFEPYVEEVCQSLVSIFERSGTPCWEALYCFTCICKVCNPPDIECYVDACIDNVFDWGLSAHLIECMRDITASSKEPYRTRLEESLLDMISVTLCGLPFRQQNIESLDEMSKQTAPPTDDEISVALEALQEFGFSNTELMGDFIRDSVLPLIDSRSEKVRRAAVSAIMKLLIPDDAEGDFSIARRMSIVTVIARMILKGLSHPEESVRYLILSSFTEPFYVFLTEPQFLFRLYFALGDESFKCRIALVELLCQMVSHDPSHILPALREQMVATLNQLGTRFNPATVEDGLLLLEAFATKAPSFVVNFADGILAALRPLFAFYLPMPESPTILSLLRCCTAVSAAMRHFDRREILFRQEVAQVCELLDTLPNDHSLYPCRFACVAFLSSTLKPKVDGESPYAVFPPLYRQLSSIIRDSGEKMELRLEAVRCVGVIGALDPHLFQSVVVEDSETTQPDLTVAFSRITQENCSRVVIQSIVRVIEPVDKKVEVSDSLLRTAIQSILSIAELCPSSKKEMGVVLAPMGRVMCTISAGRMLATALYEYTSIIRFVGSSTRLHLSSILGVFEHIWTHVQRYRFLVVRMLSAVAKLDVPLEKSQHKFLPLIFDSINLMDSSDELKYSVFAYILKHVETLQPFCDVIVNNLLAAISNTNASPEYVNCAIIVLQVVCNALYADELVGAIIRTLVNRLKNELSNRKSVSVNMEIYRNIMSTLSAMATVMQGDFIIYAEHINEVLRTYQVKNKEFALLTSQLMSGVKCVQTPEETMNLKNVIRRTLSRCDTVLTKAMSTQGEMWSHLNVFEATSEAADSEKTLAPDERRILSALRVVPVTREEWLKWVTNFSVGMLQESPFQVFRCISLPMGINATPLVEKDPQMINDVVQAGFRSLWNYASSTLRTTVLEFFRQTLRQAMMPSSVSDEDMAPLLTTSSTAPDEVLTLLLSIVEYMDHAGEPLSLSYLDLSECARNRGMLAKALYWREAAYRQDPEATVESLISLYSEVHMVDSAVGILNLAIHEQRSGAEDSAERRQMKRRLFDTSLVQLSRYAEALRLAQLELKSIPPPTPSEASGAESTHPSLKSGRGFLAYHRCHPLVESASSGREESAADHRLAVQYRMILCLSELGNYKDVLQEWSAIYKRYRGSASSTEEDDSSILWFISKYAADASIRLQSWDTLEETVEWVHQDFVLRHISAATLHLQKDQFDDALIAVEEGRKVLLKKLSNQLHESYTRAYESLIMAQQLTEMEEVVVAKRTRLLLSSSEHIQMVSKLWDSRIVTMDSTSTAWKQVLGIRGLLIPPIYDVKTRIRFAKICRQEGAHQLERFSLELMLGSRDATLQAFLSPTANPKVVMQCVSHLAACKALGPDSPYGTEGDLLRKVIDIHSKAENAPVLAKAYTRLGGKVGLEEAIECYKVATLYNPKWFLAWSLWAGSNVEALSESFSEAACKNAIVGYVRSIQLGTMEATLIQNVLKLLTLWTRHCDQETGLRELRNHVPDVPPRVWHLVVPQLIARLDSGSNQSCQLVSEIVTTVAYHYPHALVYPLNLCTMSDSERRKMWATEILSKLQHKYPVIVLQGRLMIDELVRVSALVYEQWYDKLESAATSFFGRQNKEEMVRNLMPMHETLTKPAETVVEAEFNMKFARTLLEAKEWLRSYSSTRSVADIQSAWNLYHSVYRMIDEQIKASSRLKLQFCSPKLFEARDLSIGIPCATRTHEETYHKVSSFKETIVVIASKQRPKKIGIIAQDGKSQNFLLKGREDLRLDERVMQLFGLVNVLMRSDTRSNKNLGLQIQRYSVIPLKDTVGLIGWVEGCDTLHELVKYYRDGKGIPVEQELRMLNQIISFDNPKAYDHLKVISKMEVMEFLSDHTSGHDIRKSMWAAASNCELWIEQRQMYTTSLANMSIVGYILGLGDRHPNNIMLQRSTGLVVHIDFGDCFEVAMTRDKFPEKIPFRLTRMLINALDVSGVGGAFRSSAETSMCVLRENSHSVLALLEAFIQDPLISWRLVNHPGQEPLSSNEHKTIDEQVKIANIRDINVTPRYDSITGSIDPARRTGSCSVANYLFGGEVDVVHQGVYIFNRLSSKLKGGDFIMAGQQKTLDSRVQVGRIIAEATDITNVSQSWSGWYPWW